jgi:hypothetical protein
LREKEAAEERRQTPVDRTAFGGQTTGAGDFPRPLPDPFFLPRAGEELLN